MSMRIQEKKRESKITDRLLVDNEEINVLRLFVFEYV